MAHRTTLFGVLQQLIPRHIFEKLERKHKAGRASRRFCFKEQFTVISFIMLSACSTMREGTRNLNSIPRKLYHWGIKHITLSTFSDAINKRSCAFFEDLFSEIYKGDRKKEITPAIRQSGIKLVAFFRSCGSLHGHTSNVMT